MNREALWPLKDGAFKTEGPIVADVAADETGVYVASTDSRFYCLNRGTGRLKWQFYGGRPLTEDPVLTPTGVYLPIPGQGIAAVQQGRRRVQPQAALDREGMTQFLAEDDKLVYLLRGADNVIVAVDKPAASSASRATAATSSRSRPTSSPTASSSPPARPTACWRSSRCSARAWWGSSCGTRFRSTARLRRSAGEHTCRDAGDPDACLCASKTGIGFRDTPDGARRTAPMPPRSAIVDFDARSRRIMSVVVTPDTPDMHAPASAPDATGADDDFDLDFDYDEISLLSGGTELLDDIEPLWLMLRQHHADMTPLWRSGLHRRGFRRAEGRAPSQIGRRGAARRAGGAAGEPCGYCVCTVNRDAEGEVDSLFVAPELRRRGIGDAMMSRAMPWLQERCAAGRSWSTCMSCNDAALRFYERYGFHARTVRMRYVPTPATADESVAGAVHVSECRTPEPEAPPPLAARVPNGPQGCRSDGAGPSGKRGPRQVIPIEFDVVIAHTQDQAAAAAIELQLKRDGVPVFRTHDGPAIDQTIELIVRAEDRERGMQVAEGIFVPPISGSNPSRASRRSDALSALRQVLRGRDDGCQKIQLPWAHRFDTLPESVETATVPSSGTLAVEAAQELHPPLSLTYRCDF